jgi:hypothetical protein
MAKEMVDKASIPDHNYRTHIIVGVGVFVVCVAAAVILNDLLPPQYRACVLMPGFCSKRQEQPRGAPLEELGRLRPGGPKFGLSVNPPSRY